MSDVALPTGIIISGFMWGQKNFNTRFMNAASGASQTRTLGPPRWSAEISSELNLKRSQAALWRQMLIALDGATNRLKLHDLANPAPRGTMRGTMTLLSGAAKGANTATVVASGQAGLTLRAGDWLTIDDGANSQLVHLQLDTTANGSGQAVISFRPALRTAFASATPVVWDKAYAYFRADQTDTQWASQGPVQGSFQLALTEDWNP